MRRNLMCGVAAAALLLLGACNGSSNREEAAGTSNTSAVPKTRYDLANGCYVLKSLSANAFATRHETGYAALVVNVALAEPFFMKPTALGKYLFYAKDKTLLAVSGAGVGIADTPSDATDWTVDFVEGQFTITNTAAGKALTTDAKGRLALATVPGRFGFEPVTGCTAYPEMPVDVSGTPYKGQGVDKPVIGFSDAHTHMAMSSELSDGSGHVGPSAGGVLYGQMFNRFGVTEALKDCQAFHGPEGIKDAQFIIEATPPAPHDTQGWPDFVGWPVNPNITHQGMYYKWLERAYRAGLRLMVNLGTNIEALCEVGVTAGLGQAGADCKDMSIGLKQIHYTYQLQDYIDAQEGGPGKGWFRIVKSPAEARAVINDGKLAVVLGLEFANIFDCNVSFDPLGNETRSCDEAHIDQRIEEVWNLGVRQVYLYHDVNSALGGTAILQLSPVALNLVGFYGTHRFWETESCPAVDYYGQDLNLPVNLAFYVAGADIPTAVPGTGNDPVTSLLYQAAGGTLPVYPPGRQCNARRMTPLGEYAMQQAMRRRFVLDTDHAELFVKERMMAMARAQTPAYPLVSMHGGHGGLTLDMAREMLANGGLIFPYNSNGADWVKQYQEIKQIWPVNRPLAMGYGFDGNGFGGMAEPRGASRPPIQYPFKLFAGPGWGPQFAAAGIKPITVSELRIPESGKSWNADVDGHPHYGLVADLVEEIRLEGGEEAVSALYNSAEAYLQMWEKTVNR